MSLILSAMCKSCFREGSIVIVRERTLRARGIQNFWLKAEFMKLMSFCSHQVKRCKQALEKSFDEM